jgi:hypothetical protein
MKLNASQSANAERSKPESMLEVSELPLHGCTPPIQVTPPLRLARDKRVQAR